MKILLDIDSTIYPLMDAMAALPGGEAIAGKPIDSWEMPIRELGSLERFLELLDKAFHPEVMRKFGLFPGTREGVAKLADHGVDIFVVTHRDSRFRDDTEQYLIEQKIPFRELHCDYKIDKTQFCIENDIQIIVDDAPHILTDAHSAGLQTFTRWYPYNADVVELCGTVASEDWAELADHILQAALSFDR